MSFIKKLLSISLLFANVGFTISADKDVKTTMQTGREWRPTIDTRSDAVMVYGVGGNPSDRDSNSSFEARVKSWKERDYKIHFMTGIAWGEYKDYFTGGWDGRWHLDEGQVDQRGDTIWHGRLIPYIVPSRNFLNYLKENHIKRAIDAGADAIFLEEPEFWARSGYSDAFKREWKEFYGSDWMPQHESPEATYLSNKLKYHLYYRALDEVFSFAKEYGKSLGKEIECYVPTHSLVNYSQWQIVSPEASLASLPAVDGYIAQVWTGTSREPNFYNGDYKERVFETAFLEYGSMASMTAPTVRKMFFLTDPIEDRAKDWDDYKRNYQATFTAQLMYPLVDAFEIMPWPERVYEGRYRVNNNSDRRTKIPEFYSTQMQVMTNSLNKMPRVENKVSGSAGIGVLMGNSLMFQRFPNHEGYEDPQLSNFYGLAIPLLKKGVPVETVHIENLAYPETLKDISVLVMTYSNMKPLEPSAHDYLAEWVKGGGCLVYCGADDDAFQRVPEWWNSEGKDYATPSQHLFEKMGLDRNLPEGEYNNIGKGKLKIIRKDPKEFIMNKKGDSDYYTAIKSLYEVVNNKPLQEKNNFTLERGPYSLVAVVDEGISDTPLKLSGSYIDLFNPDLPVINEITVAPGSQAFLFNLDNISDVTKPQVLAASYRETEEKINKKSYSFIAKSPIDTKGMSRVFIPGGKIKSVTVDGEEVMNQQNWDEASHTYLLQFDNNPDGRLVTFNW